jgi:hypothetical protein
VSKTGRNGTAPTTPDPSSSATRDNDDGRDGKSGRFKPGNKSGCQFQPGNKIGAQFQPGNRSGRGNPAYRRLCELRACVHEVVGKEQIRALFEKLLYLAVEEGDTAAATLVLSYSLGRPLAAAADHVSEKRYYGPDDTDY